MRSAQRHPYRDPTYPFLYRLIPSYTIKGYPGISHYKNLILAYPKTTFLSLLIPGYPGINHSSCYPGITQYKSGYGSVSFFQMVGCKFEGSSSVQLEDSWQLQLSLQAGQARRWGICRASKSSLTLSGTA